MLEFSAFSAFVIAILLLAVVLIFMGVKAVPQGWEYTVERFGRYTRSLRPGLQLIVPIVDAHLRRSVITALASFQPG